MKNRGWLIDRFIEARVKGGSFDEIAKQVGVSKPTLIRWSRVYQEEINDAKQELSKATAREIVERNRNFIIALAKYMERKGKVKKADLEVDHRIFERVSKRIFGMLGKELHCIRIKKTWKGEIDTIILEFEKGDGRMVG